MYNALLMEQKQTLSAVQMQSLQILAMTNQELQDYISEEYLENPLLECPTDRVDENMQELEKYYEQSSSYSEHYERYGEDDCNRARDIKGKDTEMVKQFIMNQLVTKRYSKTEWKLIEYLICGLDEKGFFNWDVEDIARVLSYDIFTVERCLSDLKELEPYGIFSRNMEECLKKQLEHQGVTEEEIYLMIDQYFPEILQGQFSTISRGLHLSTKKIKEYIQMIGKLNPWPFISEEDNSVEYVVPDILVRLENDQWKIEINDQWVGECKYNEYYIRMMRESRDPELKKYFQKKLERARMIVESIEQRRRTILKCTEVILNMQDEYFRYGGQLHPMTMEDVALRAQIHPSTVSRALKGKYLLYKKTIYMKDLFQSSIKNKEDYSSISSDEVKFRIRQIIEEEDKKKAYSDQTIYRMLLQEGMKVSRRTVTKYRVQMNILDSRQRKMLYA